MKKAGKSQRRLISIMAREGRIGIHHNWLGQQHPGLVIRCILDTSDDGLIQIIKGKQVQCFYTKPLRPPEKVLEVDLRQRSGALSCQVLPCRADRILRGSFKGTTRGH